VHRLRTPLFAAVTRGLGTASGLRAHRLPTPCPGIIHERDDADEEACVFRRFRERARHGRRARSLQGRIHGGPENAETRMPPPTADIRSFMNDARCNDIRRQSGSRRGRSASRTRADHRAATAAVWRR